MSAVDLRRLSPAQMVDVALVRASIPQRPAATGPRPAWLWLAALFFAVATVSIIGGSLLAGGPRTSSSTLQVNGEAVVREPVPLALHEPFTINGLEAGSRARIDLDIAGIPVGLSEVPLSGGRAEFDIDYLKWTTGGVVNVAVTVDGDAEPRARLKVAPTHRWWANAPALLVGVVALFGLASFSSHLKGFRSSPSILGPVIGLGFATAVLTLAATAVIVLSLQHVPTAGAVLLGGLSSVLAAVLLGAGARGRVRRRLYVTTWV